VRSIDRHNPSISQHCPKLRLLSPNFVTLYEEDTDKGRRRRKEERKEEKCLDSLPHPLTSNPSSPCDRGRESEGGREKGREYW